MAKNFTADGLIEALRNARIAIESMKQTAETAGAGGDEQMLQEACESISQQGLQASEAIAKTLEISEWTPSPAPGKPDFLTHPWTGIAERIRARGGRLTPVAVGQEVGRQGIVIENPYLGRAYYRYEAGLQYGKDRAQKEPA